jgi:radical SAM protein
MDFDTSYTSEDFAHSPFVMFYEVTRACDLHCKHCRACAQPLRHPSELTTEESMTLLDQIASFPKPPVLIFTGGDPLKRDDIFDLVSYAGSKGIRTAMTPSATPLVNSEALRRLKDAGLGRLALSIDSSEAATHDAFREVPGSFDRTIDILKEARSIGLQIQVNTTITRRNVGQIDAMADLFASLGIVLWSVFFLVPVGRGLAEERISPAEYEEVFAKLFEHARKQPFGIKSTEANHYRRFVLMRQGDPSFQPGHAPPGRIRRAPLGVNDGKGVVFVSHTGQVYPSGFMPIACGKAPARSLVDIYQNSDTLKMLRNPDNLHGKCGQCDFRHLCGGSRARAYAVTRDPLAAEPDCAYIPTSLRNVDKEPVLC